MSNRYTDALFLRARWTPAAALGCALLLLGACDREPPPSPPPAAVVALPVHSVASGEARAGMHYPVEVAARYANVMAFRVAGQIIERKARLGDVVHRGEVLARL